MVRKLSYADEQSIITAYLNQVKGVDLAEHFGVSQATISMVVRRNGIKRDWGRIDHIGQRFGDWTVLRYYQTKNHVAYWWCRCVCGVERPVVARNLRIGASTGCGCRTGVKAKYRAKRLPGEAAKSQLFSAYRYNARKRQLEFTITFDDFLNLVTQECHYCGLPPQQIAGHKTNGVFVYNGIDRLDSTIGYMVTNIVTSCGVCNRAKASMTYSDFIDWVKRISQHLGVGGPRGK